MKPPKDNLALFCDDWLHASSPHLLRAECGVEKQSARWNKIKAQRRESEERQILPLPGTYFFLNFILFGDYFVDQTLLELLKL